MTSPYPVYGILRKIITFSAFGNLNHHYEYLAFCDIDAAIGRPVLVWAPAQWVKIFPPQL